MMTDDLQVGGDATADGEHLVFPAGLPGFGDAHRFVRRPWGGDGSPFAVLECEDREGLAFVVVPPELFFADYEPDIDSATCDRIGLTDAADAEVLVIITLGERAADATANLLGPLVVHRSTGLAVQAVLAGSQWSSRTPLAGA